MRLDVLLVEKGLVESRNQAQALIRAGKILINDRVMDKPGTQIKGEPSIRIKSPPQPFVSRGGIKLQAAIQHFDFSCDGKIFADLGASTGGFTDCLLQNGASKIYAIDVGYGQLAWKLRQDSRVIVMERCNFRHIQSLPEPIEALVADLSFISLTKVIPAMKRIICSNGEGIVLLKPQFEAGPGKAKGGVVRDPDLRAEIIAEVCGEFRANDIEVLGNRPSPIKGAKKGNVEELLHLRFP